MGSRSDARRERPGRWRTVLSLVLIVLFAVVAPLALLAGWARATVLDTDRYVATVGPLADEPAIQQAVADAAGRVAVAQLATYAEGTSFPVPDEATVREAVHAVVASDEFAALWERANKVAHAQVVALLTGADVLGLETAGGRVTIDLGAILTAIAAQLSSLGYQVDFETAFANAPASMTIFESSELDSAQGAVRLFDRVATLLPVVCLVLLVAALAVAPRRWRAVRRAGVALAIGTALVLVLLVVGRRLYLDALGGDVPRDAAAAVFDILTRTLWVLALVLLVLGIAAVVMAVLVERRTATAAARSSGMALAPAELAAPAAGKEPT